MQVFAFFDIFSCRFLERELAFGIYVNFSNSESKNELEVIYKLKIGDRKIISSPYEFNPETHELSADIGILGYKFKQTVIIKNGRFILILTYIILRVLRDKKELREKARISQIYNDIRSANF